MRQLYTENLFAKGIKRQQKRGKNLHKLQRIINVLLEDAPLPANARPHKLKGEWQGFWECHIEGDWLLIYSYEDEALILHATGSHQDLFKKF